MSEPLVNIQGDAESLKERIWDWLDSHDATVERKIETREAMNSLLDCLDFLEDAAEASGKAG